MKTVIDLKRLDDALRYRHCMASNETWADLGLEPILQINCVARLRSLLIQ